jgi:hypothetical protein
VLRLLHRLVAHAVVVTHPDAGQNLFAAPRVQGGGLADRTGSAQPSGHHLDVAKVGVVGNRAAMTQPTVPAPQR